MLTAEEAQVITDAALARIEAENLAKYESELAKYDPKIRAAADKGLDSLSVPVNTADSGPIIALLESFGYKAFYNNVSGSLTIKW